MSSEKNYTDYPIFKGLQKPLEFMGLQGRYIYWAGATAGGTLVGFMAMYAIFGFLVGGLFAITALVTGSVMIFMKQKKGLHTKKVEKGLFVYHTSSGL